jgi:hypothetical protein
MFFPNAHCLVTDNGAAPRGGEEAGAYLEKFLAAASAAGLKAPAYAVLPGRALLYLVTPGLDLRDFMRGLGAGGRCKYKLLQPERYAAHLARYIHLEPVKAGLAAKPEDYRWSSAAQYLGAAGPAARDLVLNLLDADPAAALEKYKAMLVEPVPGKFWRPFDKNRDAVLGDAAFTAEHSPHAR